MKNRDRKKQWKQDPKAVQGDILRVAVEQFSAHGLKGARIDEIARQTSTSKRMIYYYFKNKTGLYRAALESEYRRVRMGESELDLTGLSPENGMRALIEFTYQYHRSNPEFVNMISMENVLGAAFLQNSDVVKDLNQIVIDKVEAVYQRGVEERVFKSGYKAVELHWLMSSMCFYNVSNRDTFSAGFGQSLHDEAGQLGLLTLITDAVLSVISIH